MPAMPRAEPGDVMSALTFAPAAVPMHSAALAAVPTHSAGLSVSVAVLIAAVLHALWNAVAKALPDRLTTFAMIGIGTEVTAALALPWLAMPAAAAWPWLLGSAVLHNLYGLLLIRSYRLGQFNQVYPLARGTGPLVVAAVAMLIPADVLRPAQLGGVLLVGASLVYLAFGGGARFTGKDLPAVTAALLTGLTIAAYTVLDGIGVRHSGTATGYAGYLFVVFSPAIPAYALLCRREQVRAARRTWWLGGVGGVLSVAAYALVIWAQTRAALAAVAALRECSVVVAAVIGTVVFHERLGRARIAASAGVAAGILLISLG
jgi:drug/metabolite transporter (DMT)-like permease